MPTTGKKRGISADFRLDNSGGTLTDLSTQITSVSLNNSVESFDVTAFQSTGKEYLVGFSDGKFSVQGFSNGTIIAHFMAILGSAATSSIQWGPEGTTTGNPKLTAEAFVTSFNVDNPLGPNTFSAELQVTGAITSTTY